MNILIYGIGGKMGKVLYDCIREEGNYNVACGVDKYADPEKFSVPVYSDCTKVTEHIDCIIDFSVRAAIYDYLPYAVADKIPCVIATTGYNAEETTYITEAAKCIPIFKTGNMSVGINLLLQLAKLSAKILGTSADIEIVEHHHREKVDAPSGTALLLANGVKSVLQDTKFLYGREGYTDKRTSNEVGIHAVRGGTVVGKHEVVFLLDNEVITLKHEAENKSIFARGSINAVEFLLKQKPGIYSMEDMLKT